VRDNPAEAAAAVISFWFGEVGKDRWFVKDAVQDATIGKRFAGMRDQVLAGKARQWRETPETLLAAILLLDQFSRNMFRGSARAFEADPLALELAYLALDKGWTHSAPDGWRQFLLMPLQHSEKLADQERSMAEFERLGASESLAYAVQHLEQIKRFGRFPGRNKALGRRSTDAELDALAHGAAF
jgi:uncharacterized protein (DUF924 family)